MRTVLILTFSALTFIAFSQNENYKDTITVLNANQVDRFDKNNIESMVTYYYASRIRKDTKWTQVLRDSSEWSGRMRSGITRHNREWEIIKFKNMGLYTAKDGTVSVKVYILVKIRQGEKIFEDDGVDDVEILKKDGIWTISNVK